MLRSRPARDELLGMLRKDDALVVTKLDRIGRSLINLVDVMSLLRERGVLDGDIDTTTPTGKFFFHVNAAMAEWVAAMTREHSGPVSNEWRQKAPALLTNAPKGAGR
jgi:DNA invertase Pin-like site-specific DNA recombinase